MNAPLSTDPATPTREQFLAAVENLKRDYGLVNDERISPDEYRLYAEHTALIAAVREMVRDIKAGYEADSWRRAMANIEKYEEPA